jgi:hypothetical protein
LVVELLLLKQFCVAARKRLLGLGEFFGERGDEGLGVARELSLKVLDLVFESDDEAADSFEPLIVEPADGRMTENEYPLCADGIGWRRGWKIEGKRDVRMTVRCALLVAV